MYSGDYNEWWPVIEVYEVQEDGDIELTEAEFAEYRAVLKAFKDWQIRLGNDAGWIPEADDGG